MKVNTEGAENRDFLKVFAMEARTKPPGGRLMREC